MKKFLAVLLTIAMVFGCILALSSCTQPEEQPADDPKPETNFKTAEENLTDNNYFVVISHNYNDDLDVGVKKVLKAYDLERFIDEKEDEYEDWYGDSFDFEEWKESMGSAYISIMEAWAMGVTPDLTITLYTDEKMAEFEHDRLQMQVDREDALADAYEKDAQNNNYYHQNKVYQEYNEKGEELTYEQYKYILENFYNEISDDEKEAYESFIEDYEHANDILFGRDGDIVWHGTKAAIEATVGND